MPSVIATNVVQVNMQYRVASQMVENVYHVHKGTAWTLSDIGALAAEFLSWETTDASPLRSEDCWLERVTATDLTSLTSGRVDTQLTIPINGSDIGDCVPQNVTFAVKGNIGQRGKGRNGRTFWIGIPTSKVSNALVDVTYATSIQTALNDLNTAVATAIPGAALGVIHLYIDGVFMSPAPFSEITSWTYTNLFVDSQRDRLPDHKAHKRPTP